MRLTSFFAMSIICLPVFAATPTETIAAFHAALAAGQSERVTDLMSPEIQIYESGYVERSRDEYAGHHLAADIAFARATSIKVLKQNERIGGDVAVVMQETETTGKYKGKNIQLLGTETALLENRGDKWVITHIHWSSRKPK